MANLATRVLRLLVKRGHALLVSELEQAFPRGMSLRGRRAQTRFRNILRKHGVELVITAAAIERGVDRVAPRLARAGIRFLTPVPPSMLDADEADDLPLIPVPPSP